MAEQMHKSIKLFKNTRMVDYENNTLTILNSEDCLNPLFLTYSPPCFLFNIFIPEMFS